MIIYSCFSHVLFSWRKHIVSIFFKFSFAPGAVKMDYFFLENKLSFYGWLFDMTLNQRFTILYALNLLQFLLTSAFPSDWCCWKVGLKILIWMLKNSLWGDKEVKMCNNIASDSQNIWHLLNYILILILTFSCQVTGYQHFNTATYSDFSFLGL